MSEVRYMEIGQIVTVNGRDMMIASYHDSDDQERRRAVLVAAERGQTDRTVAGDVQFAVGWLNKLLATEGIRFDVDVSGPYDGPQEVRVRCYRRLA